MFALISDESSNSRIYAVLKWLKPQDQLADQDINSGLRMLLYDGACSQAMGTLTGGAVLVGFAVLLGASNLVIGLLAAVGPLTQLLQIPTVFLVDRTGLRKALVVLSSFLSRLSWLAVAVIPWLVPADQRVAALLSMSAAVLRSWHGFRLRLQFMDEGLRPGSDSRQLLRQTDGRRDGHRRCPHACDRAWNHLGQSLVLGSSHDLRHSVCGRWRLWSGGRLFLGASPSPRWLQILHRVCLPRYGSR